MLGVSPLKRTTLPVANKTNGDRMAKKKEAQEESLEKQLWKSADKLRKNIDAAEYKHVVLGLIFLKYISDAFEELYATLKADEGEYAGADPEDKDEYKAENVFFVPQDARWTHLQAHAKQPTIGKTVDEAMDTIEKGNTSLKGVLPKVYARQNLDPTSLGELIDLISNIALGDAKSRSADVLGHVFEYFLGEFALVEGKKGGQFYTPRSVVELLVEMLEPYKGRVLDPCCGSGGMFVQSEKFVTEHQGKINDISIYGQESNQTTWRLAKMNLAIRGIDSSQVKWNNEGSFLNDAHKDLKADYIIANPPFNVSDWSGDLLRKDGRWQYGTPPTGNANYAWIQHFIYHLAPSGQAGFVLAKGALTSKTSGEGEIRKALVEAGLIDCIVNLPAKLFLNTQIPASLWFLSRNRTNGALSNGSKLRNRTNEILFIDARNMGHLINRRTRELSTEDISTIAGTYHNWRNPEGDYEDVKGFCNAAPIERVKELDYVLTPGRYVGLAEEADDFNFAERFSSLKAEFENQLKEEAELNERILDNLAKVKVDG
ncbi:Type I restriction-modification system, DNA-methyltransferase subunit M [bacterium endosymbiont of Bathymodiolus sp. 5 South]|jgi:type I restriction enzyme M protein|nr:Type I restriction-modification system, DNA-methyltransferase subunit M [bacterium endosymbiont of Bathymodiolus sp. 5 South]VVH58997.1 Type I restriction-modification system, DNA-methyltransferase subunit M (EC [uncultured Gammaproteobacteria bacterium]VVH62746.1 Type I restriction-modification system, DNA-methyltransferase subunit M (EC [uncultured Gammaproteobacteria bacterium]VVM27664.1 Type I restriction-modification system, DNA-methyltransferase subunit M (EC [uncultured Gammaproteobact